ncbi:MAG: GNAT family N-acetyltransferase [Candidatus Marinimicrobia bacterium]|nr:GNAT family N-acetyltransferase [Candidatus Neomarinimicrobiota bacterium]
MEKIYNIKNNEKILIRNLEIDDLEKSYAFFNSIPAETRRYFRSDVTQKEHLKERINKATDGTIIRRIAISNDKILGDSSLEIATSNWKKGEAQLRLVISPNQFGNGVQYALAKDLYDIAISKNVSKVITKIMRPQTELQEIYQKLGFKTEGLLPDYVHDLKGVDQDLIIMIATIEEFHKAYEFIGNWINDEHASINAGEM